MIKRLYAALPGPAVAKVAILIVLVVLTLTLLVILFEWAGQFLDTGGVVG